MSDSSGPGFEDHFSAHAASYAASRPHYPTALYDFLAAEAPGRTVAWDCATGNGQAAAGLAAHFDRVVASDASREQIDAAVSLPNVDFRVARAEESGLSAASMDLVTVGQALHWFDIEAFFAEARRVLRPAGLLAYWCYGLCRINQSCDTIVGELYERVDAFWPPERTIVERAYRDIVPPFTTLDTPGFVMEVNWTARQLLAYVRTWSACQRYARFTGEDPLGCLEVELANRWGEGSRPVRWPLQVTVCRRPGSDT